jgi:hypothetical protein
MTFADLASVPDKTQKDKAQKTLKIKTVGAPVADYSDLDPRAVRKWAHGHKDLVPADVMPGDRGRINSAVFALYKEHVSPEDRKERSAEDETTGKIIYADPARRFAEGTVFVGNVNGKKTVSDERQICGGGCGVSIGWCRCPEGTIRTVLTEYGRTVVEPVRG